MDVRNQRFIRYVFLNPVDPEEAFRPQQLPSAAARSLRKIFRKAARASTGARAKTRTGMKLRMIKLM